MKASKRSIDDPQPHKQIKRSIEVESNKKRRTQRKTMPPKALSVLTTPPNYSKSGHQEEAVEQVYLGEKTRKKERRLTSAEVSIWPEDTNQRN